MAEGKCSSDGEVETSKKKKWEGKNPTNIPGSDWEGSVLDKGLPDSGVLLMWGCFIQNCPNVCTSTLAMTPADLKTLFLLSTEVCFC